MRLTEGMQCCAWTMTARRYCAGPAPVCGSAWIGPLWLQGKLWIGQSGGPLEEQVQALLREGRGAFSECGNASFLSACEDGPALGPAWMGWALKGGT